MFIVQHLIIKIQGGLAPALRLPSRNPFLTYFFFESAFGVV